MDERGPFTVEDAEGGLSPLAKAVLEVDTPFPRCDEEHPAGMGQEEAAALSLYWLRQELDWCKSQAVGQVIVG